MKPLLKLNKNAALTGVFYLQVVTIIGTLLSILSAAILGIQNKPEKSWSAMIATIVFAILTVIALYTGVIITL